VAQGSIAERAGLKFEDEILSVAGKRTPNLEAATLAILEDLTDDGTIRLHVRGAAGDERDADLVVGERSRELTQPEALLPGLGFDIWRPRVKPLIGEVVAGGAADAAGLKSGDEVLAFDGQRVEDFTQFSQLIEKSAGRQVDLEIRRQGVSQHVAVSARQETSGDSKAWRFGIKSSGDLLDSDKLQDIFTVQRYSPLPALGAATLKTWDTSVFTLRIVGRIVTGDVSLKAISGPISIAETTGFAARQGWRVFLTTLALISISLGVLNLLPIPILDGGQVVYQLAELVKGRPVSERAQLLGQQIGIAMLILMMTLAFYNDIARHLN
jgi:regulator of sigma E protease